MNIDFKEKYLKYKNKYLKLKELLGGANPFNKNTQKIYFMFKLKDTGVPSNTYQRFIKRYADAFENTNIMTSKQNFKPHITLTEINVNMKNPNAQKFIDIIKDTIFLKNLKNKFDNILKNNPITIDSGYGNYKKLGNFVAREYKFKNNQEQIITLLRKELYNKLVSNYQKKTGLTINFPPNKIQDKLDQTKYHYIFQDSNNQDLYGIPDYYFGQGIITAHVSIRKIDNKFDENGIKNAFTNVGSNLPVSRIDIPKDGDFILSYRYFDPNNYKPIDQEYIIT
jgi:glutaredoxin-related protein